jgi:V/A-type H+-transporting ATPase subunit D
MAKIKHTKNELKAQRDALTRFERFLPMLQLKKQQLQGEIQNITHKIEAKQAERGTADRALQQWVALFAEDTGMDKRVRLAAVHTGEGNIAGVPIPVLQDIDVRIEPPDLFATPPWIDDGMSMLDKLIRIRIELDILEEQRRRIAEELRSTAQRVNLFEKVKIPECRENIRMIKIFLGDEQTAAVVRGKIAKSRDKT